MLFFFILARKSGLSSPVGTIKEEFPAHKQQLAWVPATLNLGLHTISLILFVFVLYLKIRISRVVSRCGLRLTIERS